MTDPTGPTDPSAPVEPGGTSSDPPAGPAKPTLPVVPPTGANLAEASQPDSPTPWGPVEPTRPGARTFSLEGRRAPGLYLVGWLGVVLGLPLFVVALLSPVVDLGRILLLVFSSGLLAAGLVAAAGSQAIERRDRADLAYRGPGPVLVFAASIPLSILVTLPIVLLGPDRDAPLASLLAVLATAAIWIGLVGLTVVGTGGLGWADVLAGIAGAPAARIAGDLLLGAGAAIPVIIVTAIVAQLLVGWLGVAPEPPIPIPSDSAGLAVSLLAAAVVAPISEEIFYRGFVTTAWVRAHGTSAGIVLGALFFAFVHVLTLSGSSFDPAARAAVVGFAGRLPVALALGWIFVRRQSLAASIGLHAAFNGLLLVLASSVS